MSEYIVVNSPRGRIRRKAHNRKRTPNPCWTCDKAPRDGCMWSKYKLPVDGWIAEPIVIPDNYPFDKGYHITYCPEYEPKKEKQDYLEKYRKLGIIK